jgi:hypothetical protein
MSVCPQGLPIDPGMGNGVDGLVTVKAKEFGDDSCRCNLDEDDVI